MAHVRPYQFWRGQLAESPYDSWGLGKRSSLDHWMARQLLGWEPYQLRYLGKEDFQRELRAVRVAVFADVVSPGLDDLASAPKDEQQASSAATLTPQELAMLRRGRALEEYRDLEAKMLSRRAGQWSSEELAELHAWVEKKHDLLRGLDGLQDPYPQVEGGVTDKERREARMKVLQYMVFPLLRPELQGLPYLSTYLARAFMETAKQEAAAGLRPILTGPLSKLKADYVTAETNLNDSLSKLVIKSFLTVMLDTPFIWHLLRYVLRDLVGQMPTKAWANLPELRDLESAAEVAGVVDEKWQHLTDVLTHIATDEETSSLSQDISLAYQAVNDLHRIAEEVLHARGPGHPLDEHIEAHINQHHGWITEVGQPSSIRCGTQACAFVIVRSRV